MKLKELFKTLATRAGVPDADAKLLEAINAIPDFDVDDDTVAKPITTNLITETEAEARPKIKNKFTAEVLNGIDALLDPVLGDFFDQTEIDAIKADKATTKKLTKLIDKAKAAKAAGGNSAETAQAITKLNEEITKLKSDKETDINTLNSKHATERYFDRLGMKVIARQDVTDFAKAKDGRRVIADFQDTLDSVCGVLDIASGKVMQKADPTLPLFIDNKAVTADTLLEKTLTENEYIKKSEPATSSTITVPGGAAKNDTVDPSVQRNIDRAKAKTA
jgi:hypothetical protein